MKITRLLSLILMVILMLALLSVPAFAERPGFTQPASGIYDGILTYRSSYGGGGVSITKCDASASGIIEIPAYIDDSPVTSIGDYAFQHCTGITGVVIPETVTGIGYSAFYGCTSLESIDIPISVTEIEYGAFYNCKALKTASIADLVQWCAVEKDGEYANPAHITGTLLLNGSPLTDVVIPDGVTVIEDYTFYGCKTISSIQIPDSVTAIGECALYGCEKLDKMTVSAAVSEIGDGAFSACDNVTIIDIAESNAHYKNIEGCLVEVGSKTLIKGFNNGKIPTDGSVTRLGEYAFSGCEELTSITVPDCVETIGSSAFSNCEKLQSITLPKNLTVVRSSVFSGCTALTSITLPDTVKTIGISAFRGCSKLSDITLSSSLTDIQAFAFADCTSLNQIIITKNVSNIGDGIFDGCSDLNAFLFEKGNNKYGTPDGTCIIDYSTGILLRGSEYTVIPEDVNRIGKYAFSGIADMTVIGIPSSVGQIDIGAFDGCQGLKTVYFGGADSKAWKNGVKICADNEVLETVEFVYGNSSAPIPKHPNPIVNQNLQNESDSDSNLTLWIIIAAVAVMVIAGAVVLTAVLKKKKSKQ